MQKPADYRASILVLVLVLMKTNGLMVSPVEGTVEGGDQHDQTCIPPAAIGEYNFAYRTGTLPVLEPADVQDLVLVSVSTQLTNGFTEGPFEFCSQRGIYSAVSGNSIYLYSYAYCGDAVDRDGCADCLFGGAQVIRDNCPNGCDGAQASTINCCIRFEEGKFCKAT